MTRQELLSMELHQVKVAKSSVTTNYTIHVIRVMGGWIYETWFNGKFTSTFVPEPNKKDQQQ